MSDQLSLEKQKTITSLLKIIAIIRGLSIRDNQDKKLQSFFLDRLHSLLKLLEENYPILREKRIELIEEIDEMLAFLKKNEGSKIDHFFERIHLYSNKLDLYIDSIKQEINYFSNNLFLLEKELRETILASKKQLKKINEEEIRQKSNISSLNKEVGKRRDEFLELREDSKLMNEQLAKDKEALKVSKKKLKERALYLDELMGKEVGKSLFLTFDKRKKELNRTVTIWVILVLITSGWAFYFTEQLFANKDFSTILWTEYIANTIKLVPLFIVLFFCIRQYQRERNFQEEYAFKSAVALTINAYSEQIEDKDKRDDMVIESVYKVYDSPITKHLSKEKIKTQSMLKGIEVMKDTVTDVTKDAVEIVKAAKK